MPTRVSQSKRTKLCNSSSCYDVFPPDRERMGLGVIMCTGPGNHLKCLAYLNFIFVSFLFLFLFVCLFVFYTLVRIFSSRSSVATQMGHCLQILCILPKRSGTAPTTRCFCQLPFRSMVRPWWNSALIIPSE